ARAPGHRARPSAGPPILAAPRWETIMGDELNAALDALEHSDRAALIEAWRRRYGAPPKHISQVLLRKILAYDLQAKALGDLSSTAKRNLKSALRHPTRKRIGVGARLVREWNGVRHTVEIGEDGYRWRDALYPSLSAVATAITGAKWSGPRFFGLDSRR
ncbi:MAG: DUF2924 domain-containing protein, partial [Pseudomonadota bacterium]